MIINNEFYKEELREKWKNEMETKSVNQFCKENRISKTYFYMYIGRKNEATEETRYKYSNAQKQKIETKIKNFTPEKIKQCEDLYLAGNDFREVAKLTGENEWDIMGILDDKWQDRQIQNNANSRENIYCKSIKDLINEGFSDKFIAELFSVAPAKIKGFREGLTIE